MARGKKVEQVLTLEEKLEQALVPEDEQPYSIPENWCWCKIAFISNFERGITFPASAKEHEATKTNIPCLRTTNIQDELKIEDLLYIDKSYMKNNEEKYVRSDDIIMSSANSKELVGKVSYVYGIPFPMTFGGFILIIRAKKINSRYLFYYLRLNFLCGKFMGESTQTTNIANINTTKLKNLGLPLPPITEQQRIVDRIECLFSKLDEAKEKVQAVVDGFELRKSAILHKAFTGELTNQWRQVHNIGLDSWEYVELGNICKVNPKKIDTTDLSDDLEVSFFPMSALSEIYGEITEPQTRQLKEVRTGYTNFSEGDVVFAKITPCMENGKSAVIGKLVNDIGFGTTEFYVLRCGPKLYNFYLYHLLRDKHFRDEAKAVMTGAVGQQRVPKSFLEKYILHLPSVPEQKEIAQRLDEMFAREIKISGIAESVLTQIDYIKKSILSRAFRGELGTNDPAEESAEELLKTVL